MFGGRESQSSRGRPAARAHGPQRPLEIDRVGRAHPTSGHGLGAPDPIRRHRGRDLEDLGLSREGSADRIASSQGKEKCRGERALARSWLADESPCEMRREGAARLNVTRAFVLHSVPSDRPTDRSMHQADPSIFDSTSNRSHQPWEVWATSIGCGV